MKSYPLILTAAEVRAVLNGTKTQHRVRVKFTRPAPWQIMDEGDDGKPWPFFQDEFGDYHPMHCPFGVPGDTLYLRETTKRFTGCPVAGKPWPSDAPWVLSPDGDPYKALLHVVGNEEHVAALEYHAACVTVPSAHMPRWASRITVVNESVRVQRLQDISEEDARAEGVCSARPQFLSAAEAEDTEDPRIVGYPEGSFARDNLRRKWSMKHGADSWSRNDWVFALTFKRVEAAR